MPSIAIVGAGPAGLTLARLLLVNVQEHNISNLQLTIFENDASAKARWAQGGTLDLHPSTGIAALKAARMWEKILPHMRYDDQEYVFADMNATAIVHFVSSSDSGIPGDQDRPEVDREVLKDYLLDAVEDIGGNNAVSWGKHLTSANGATGILKFKDGTQAGPFDLIVGADGAWSKIRNVLTDVKPHFAGVSGFEAWVDKDHSGTYWEKFSKLFGNGNYFAYSRGQSVMAQRMEDGSLKVGIWTLKGESWPADIVKECSEDEDKIRELLLTEFAAWDDQFKQLLRCSWHYRQWPLYELPIGHRWDHKKGWTMIGDAAHLMTPFAGEGVNAAMKDALELSISITAALKDDTSLDEAVAKFEHEMFPRVTKVQKETARNKAGGFRQDAPVGFLTEYMGVIFEEAGYDTEKGWVTWVLPMVKALAYSFFWSVARIGYVRRLIRRT